jgi:transposase
VIFWEIEWITKRDHEIISSIERGFAIDVHARMIARRPVSQFLFPGDELFETTPAQPVQKPGRGIPRLRVPCRDQAEMSWESLDERLDPDSQARVVWSLVAQLELDAWLRDIKAIEHHVGRNATDPRLLVALWVFATLKGVGSARELERLCTDHLAYRWLCGGVSVNYHMLADFRSQGGDKWDELLTQIVATLMSENLVTMQRVAQDGMKVRADAGKSSFRSGDRIKQFLEDARLQVETLKTLADSNPDELTKQQRAARDRAARERQARIEEAAKQCETLRQEREKSAKQSGRKPTEARASITDPQARVMIFSDGGYRPGYNVQYATDTVSGIIVGVEVTNAGTDSEQMPPMLDQLETRYQRLPQEILVDGGFASLDAIDATENRNCVVYAPVKDLDKQKKAGKDPYARKTKDTDATAAWRRRMGEEASKVLYRLRSQTAEWVNALCRNRGFRHMPVRGRTRCKMVATLYAITHNLIHQVNVRAAMAKVTG